MPWYDIVGNTLLDLNDPTSLHPNVLGGDAKHTT